MNLNPNSFFFRWYLGYSRSDTWHNPHPNTFCDLAWRFIKRTVLYYVLLHTILSTLAVTIVHGVLLTKKDGVVNLFGIENPFINFFIGAPAVIGQVIILVGAILGLIIGMALLIDTTFNKSNKLQSAASSTGQVFSAIHTRLFKKACVMITIKDPNEKDFK